MTVITAKHGLLQERVLVLATAADEAAAGALDEAGARVERCSDVEELCRGIREGGAAAVVAAERLTPEEAEGVGRVLGEQPRWSDFPIVLLTSDAEAGRRAQEALGGPGSAVMLERPVSRTTLASVVALAVRARQRQYELRDQLAERERHERALREGKERYRQLLDSSPDGVFAASMDGRIVYANSAAPGLFDASGVGEVLGTSFLERVAKEDRARVLRRLRRSVRSGRREGPMECQWVRPGGRTEVVELSISPLPWDGAAAVQVVARNITARRAAEERQRFVAELSDRLRDLEDPREIMEAAASAMVAHLGVARALFADVEENGSLARRAWGSGEPAPPEGATFCMTDLRADAVAELAAGRSLVVCDALTDERVGGPAAPRLAAIHLRAGVCAPVVVQGRLVAFFLVHQREPRAWTEEEVALVEEVGRRTWLAVDRARAIARLRESERSLRALTESLPQIVWSARPDGTLDLFNRRWEEYTGLSGRTASEMDWLPLVHEEDREQTLRRWRRAVREGTPYELEHRVRRIDGEFRWHLTRAFPLRDAEGRVVRWFGTATDIHDRKQMEAALRTSEEEFRTTFELSAVGQSHSAPETGRLLRVNRKLCEITGYSEEELLGRTFFDITHPEDRERNRADYERLLRGEINELSMEKRYIRKDGEVIWVDVSTAIVRDPSGRPLRCVAAVQDTTARRHAEEELRASGNQFRQLADAMPQIVWSATADGRVDYCNKRWYDLTGGPPCEDGDDPWAPVLHPEDAEAHAAAWRESMRTGQPMQVEYRVLERATGQYRWHLGRMVPVLDASGKVARWYGSSTDIDDQKIAQQRLSELVDELNRSNRELEDFAHIASHDLKEPLRGIRNYSSFLLEDYGDVLDAEGQRKLRTIDRLGKRMDDLISSLLYYSQVGRTELAIENTDLNQVVLEVLESLGPLLSERGVDVRLPRPLPTVRCDRVRVAEVYRNLISNAIKYNNKPDPWVEISWRPPASEPEREGAWPVLYVRDNGIGIPARHYGTVFGIFKRLHGRDEYGGGTGSGLAFVKRIIERHRGRVWIESADGEGTTFCFTLGREEHAAAQTAHPHR